MKPRSALFGVAPLVMAPLVMAMLGLSACGFTPLYGDAMVSGLSRVAVSTPDSRLGYRLREHLEDALLFDRSAPPQWRVDVELSSARHPVGRRIDDTAARYELTLEAAWTLTPVTGGEALTGREVVTVTYASADQPYAAIAAQEDAENRAAEALAQKLRLALARTVSTTGG